MISLRILFLLGIFACLTLLVNADESEGGGSVEAGAEGNGTGEGSSDVASSSNAIHNI